MNLSRRSLLVSAVAGAAASLSRRAPAAAVPSAALLRPADLPRPAAHRETAARHFGIHDDLAAARARYGVRRPV